ncbi:MAG: ABC transporter permease [Gammaproteobacteria bacterium]|nr:ABC transporter permease [Gammaproteobacteria bacterium]MBU1732562.1 ABC transporter permease [Gammaproteobacteria bacterium]MBU1893425.1 ABC transporter permease [Gammaproteobacteria bacterium]
MTGLLTLFYKELLRFWKVSLQTVLSPLVTTLLYLLIFSHVLESHVQVYSEVNYTAFLVPGLVMMAMLQNAFSNSSSSLIQSKMTGNIVFMLLPPLAYWEFFVAYVAASVARGAVVGLGVGLAGLWFVPLTLAHPLWMLAFAVLGCAILGAAGIIASLWADNYDQMAAVQNFIIVPLTFLSGVFYSIHSLPPFWQAVSHANPFFYLIDGFRYGFFGVSDVSPLLALTIVATCFLALSLATLLLLKSGYKLRK